MKVLHAVHHFAPCVGGLERVALDSCLALKARGHDCRVVCLDKCSKAETVLPAKENVQGIEVQRVPFFDLNYYKVAPRILEAAEGVDLIHVHGIGFFSDWFLLTKFLHRKPVVVSTHGGVFHTRNLGLAKGLYFQVVQRLLLGLADAVLAVSKNDLALFQGICPKTVLLENAIDADKFSKVIPGAKTNWLFVGRLAGNKRLDRLIETVWHLKNDVPGLKLFLVGDDFGGLTPRLQALARQLSVQRNVEFCGPASDRELKAYFAKCGLFVSASEYEGFGLSVLEAMSAGLVPAVQKNEAFRHVVRHGENGFLLDYSKPELAAEELHEILKLPAKKLAETGKAARAAAQGFDWGQRVKELEAVYQQAVKR